MKKIIWLSAAAVFSAAAFAFVDAAPSKDGAQPTREFKLVNIEYKETKAWIPGTLIARKGETVRISLVNKTPSGKHGFAIHDFGVETEVAADGKPAIVEFTADKAGLFTIHCHLHPAHIGGQLLILEN